MPKLSDLGWAWFDKALNEGGSNEVPEDLPAQFARCFSGPEGEAVLSHLAEMTLARPLGANAHNGILRHLEGQRYLVSYMMGLVRQGREG
ncbi:hypothetical protein [Terasakiella sp. SH-1]|uniref:Bbp19 family protein n=1 Tax=Terasakiella sp. SH-1 TaxID=2560057 RepID=UPI001073FC7D|nr:hypothetical protein [Terasakiella sp. SH-1]